MRHLACCFAVAALGAVGPMMAVEGGAQAEEIGKTVSFLRQEKEFPLILYGVNNVAEFPEVREMGFTHIYTSGSPGGFSGDISNPERMQRLENYLDQAAENGLKVMFCLDGHRRIARGAVGIEQMRGVIRRFKEHPAVGFWYLHDEPNLPSGKSREAMLAAQFQEEGAATTDFYKETRLTPEQLTPFYKMIKTEAPGVPVILMMAISDTAWWKDAWKGFYDVYDIVSYDIYPIYAEEFPDARLDRVSGWMEEYREGTDKPVMPCLQIFSWNAMSRRVARAREAGRTDIEEWRLPNREELRYWQFASLIQGAPGLVYYSYKRQVRSEKFVEEVLKPAVSEFRKFTQLVHPLEAVRLGELEKKDLLSATWQKEGKGYLALVNNKPVKQSVSAAPLLQKLNTGAWKPWGFTRGDAVTVSGKRVTEVGLNPWEVLIWEID